MAQRIQMLQGQALPGSQYPGQRPAPMASAYGRPGQAQLVGVGSLDEPATPDPMSGKCAETREVDGVHQRCGAWAVKESDPPRCIGHKRSNEKRVAANGDEPTGDQGLRQDAP